MEVAILGEDFEDITCLIGKDDIVGHDNGGATARIQDTHHVLNKVELFIAGRHGEIIPVWRLVGSFGAKGRIGHNAVTEVPPLGFIDSISQIDVGLDAVEVKVHQGQSSGSGDQFGA